MSSIVREAEPGLRGTAINDLSWSELDAQTLADAYQRVRQTTDRLTVNLSAEDQNLQSMPEVSPVKWHRAHTTWFFETFVLGPEAPEYPPFDPDFAFLFNSYYNGVGRQYPRAQRSLISRPDKERVGAYRRHVDQAMGAFLSCLDQRQVRRLAPLIVLGLNHEQQHQELIVTDIKHSFSHNPSRPAWTRAAEPADTDDEIEWVTVRGGLIRVGQTGESFCFDNETPSHQVFVKDFQIASRPVTCGEFQEFIADDGYQRAELWLSDGWDWVRRDSIRAPLYWSGDGDEWTDLYTLGGQRQLDPAEPLCHVSFYEACAFAHWAGARLPTESEWELAATPCDPSVGHYSDSMRLHPRRVQTGQQLNGMFGDVWEWTASSYAPYPGFKPASGAVGEYNGKFMANQMVLRGGSCATPMGHIRASYRNFFYPVDRWQFSGLRLARDLES
jgi:ergothioneine biosynthesis protein EgtB